MQADFQPIRFVPTDTDLKTSSTHIHSTTKHQLTIPHYFTRHGQTTERPLALSTTVFVFTSRVQTSSQVNMFSIGKKLYDMYSSSTGTSERSVKPSATDLLSEMASAVPGENKWKLTNIGGIGSDQDKDVREKAAESEEEFENAGQAPGIEIWRIEKFQPEKLEIRAGNLSLYSGDCYIILKTTETEGGQLDWQLHYWIGKDSTQDESGSAAYFTVNIDDLLNQKVWPNNFCP